MAPPSSSSSGRGWGPAAGGRGARQAGTPRAPPPQGQPSRAGRPDRQPSPPLRSSAPARPSLHIVFRMGGGGGSTRGPEGEFPAAAPGCWPARTIGVLPAGEGRRRRCLQAWRGLCALRWWLSLSDCSKAAEKSAAVPLPVEAAAAAAEDAHWRSQGSPRRSRPRPRSAPRSYLPPGARPHTPAAPGVQGAPQARAEGPGHAWVSARRPHIWCYRFLIPASLQLLQLCTAGRALSASPLPEPGHPPASQPSAPTEMCSQLPGECQLRRWVGISIKAYCSQ